MKAVILAGGKGTRLRPLTYSVPKPMLPYRQKPILEHIIDLLKSNGITDIILTISHLGYQIKNHFGDGSRFGVKIEYIEEDEPLGTAGCLNPIRDKLNETFIVFGGDNLTDLNIRKFIEFHKEKEALITIGLFGFEHKVSWGIYELNDDDSVKAFKEKPTFNYKAGTMIFCIEPRIFDFIQDNKEKPGIINITDHIIPELIKKGEKVYGYLHKGEWIDIGKPEDLQGVNDDE
jgi:mannose-1-phosphate guanylyltransferase/phosphomannomutase